MAIKSILLKIECRITAVFSLSTIIIVSKLGLMTTKKLAQVEIFNADKIMGETKRFL